MHTRSKRKKTEANMRVSNKMSLMPGCLLVLPTHSLLEMSTWQSAPPATLCLLSSRLRWKILYLEF